MLISVLQAKTELGQHHPFKFVTTADKLNLGAKSPFEQSEILITGESINLGDSLLVTGMIEVCGQYECNRCLDAYQLKEKISFNECFREKNQPLSHGQSEEDFLLYEGDTINIDELVREHLLLNEPLQTWCSEDCQGLCPVCGVNRNQIKCNCTLTTGDPRLAVLSQLMQDK